MRTRRLPLFGFALLGLTNFSNAQTDGDHLITNGFGWTSLAVDALAPAAPVNLTIGNTPGLGATLRVRGDELPVDDPMLFGTELCTFRTDVPFVREQSWWMYRDANHIGRIWHDAIPRAFHFQSMEPADLGLDRYSGAMIQNDEFDGLWVVQNGIPEGARLFPNAAQILDRDGYVALGASEGWLSVPVLTDIRGPWSRLHLFDQTVGTIPYFGWRSQMRNGTLMTGNSDLAYMGHWYDQGVTGSGTPVDDNSKVVFGVA